ncbi:TrmO family methyltransferase [Pleomorphomonas sp. JP5]|uniref:TrmO family methyltransferase domain-containing protein n=1 Tax=Pleomorphomonas sp. JP5 TaxID=2942998 RepID=UPI002043CCAA|nr:TrmO family methyltransferase [Pleomorphomonas sp. JP5]MCM5556744.1 TrmO family methyltransferase [Pleomorphomonas sp. JP5]
MTSCRLVPIGRVVHTAEGPLMEIEPAYRDGLTGLDAFRWIIVHWFAHEAERMGEAPLVLPAPYRGALERLGVLATRSPLRPNPLCMTVVALAGLDLAAGIVRPGWIDCDDGTPILDIKPYQPSFDRVENPEPPTWCAAWPGSVETSGAFDWASVFPD